MEDNALNIYYEAVHFYEDLYNQDQYPKSFPHINFKRVLTQEVNNWLCRMVQREEIGSWLCRMVQQEEIDRALFEANGHKSPTSND